MQGAVPACCKGHRTGSCEEFCVWVWLALYFFFFAPAPDSWDRLGAGGAGGLGASGMHVWLATGSRLKAGLPALAAGRGAGEALVCRRCTTLLKCHMERDTCSMQQPGGRCTRQAQGPETHSSRSRGSMRSWW